MIATPISSRPPAGGGQHPGGGRRVLGLHPGQHDGRGSGAITKPHADPGDDQTGDEPARAVVQVRRQQQVPGRDDQRAEGQHLRAEAGGELARLHRGREVTQPERQEDQPRLQCRQAQPVLQEERQDQEERRHHELVGEVDDHACGERPLPEQGQVDEREAAAGDELPLVQGERAEQRDRGGQDMESLRPARPVCCPSTSGSTIATRPSETSAAPMRSIRLVLGARDSGMTRGASATAARPIASTNRNQ